MAENKPLDANEVDSGAATVNSGASYPVSHVEWEVANGDKTAAFFKALFGWSWQRFSEHYWLSKSANGVAIGLLEKSSPRLLQAACPVFITVPDIAEALDKAESLGAKLVEPRMAIPNYGAWAKLKEPGGNTVGLFEALD